MTLRQLLALLPEGALDIPLCVLDTHTGHAFEMASARREDDEYVAPDPPPPASMSEATRTGPHVLLSVFPGEFEAAR